MFNNINLKNSDAIAISGLLLYVHKLARVLATYLGEKFTITLLTSLRKIALLTQVLNCISTGFAKKHCVPTLIVSQFIRKLIGWKKILIVKANTKKLGTIFMI